MGLVNSLPPDGLCQTNHAKTLTALGNRGESGVRLAEIDASIPRKGKGPRGEGCPSFLHFRLPPAAAKSPGG